MLVFEGDVESGFEQQDNGEAIEVVDLQKEPHLLSVTDVAAHLTSKHSKGEK